MRVALALVGAVCSVTSVRAAPPEGRYQGTFCAENALGARNCGSADVALGPGGVVLVRIADIVYRVTVQPVPTEVVITQGSMQLDEFFSGTEWSGERLRFGDAEKAMRYELRLEAPKAAPR